jgi:DNA-binding MarR family transcriptional regulator
MAALAATGRNDKLDFTFLRNQLDLTDGNLGAHLLKLEEAGYIKVTKKFEGRKPRTLLHITGAGRDAFAAHVQALEELLRPERKS